MTSLILSAGDIRPDKEMMFTQIADNRAGRISFVMSSQSCLLSSSCVSPSYQMFVFAQDVSHLSFNPSDGQRCDNWKIFINLKSQHHVVTTCIASGQT